MKSFSTVKREASRLSGVISRLPRELRRESHPASVAYLTLQWVLRPKEESPSRLIESIRKSGKVAFTLLLCISLSGCSAIINQFDPRADTYRHQKQIEAEKAP
jgi:hypothetical protein